MVKNRTIVELAKYFNRDRSTVLRWIEQNRFPNAELVESPLGSYWVIPESDVENFKTPERGRKRKISNRNKGELVA